MITDYYYYGFNGTETELDWKANYTITPERR